MGITERRERERRATRARIMDAARELFAREGYEAVSMRRIAEAIEYSPTAIYVHFNDKESLIRELCSMDFLELGRRSATLGKVKDPVERIRRLGKLYIDFGLKHPNHYRLMFMTPKTIGEAGVTLTEEDLRRRGNPEQDGYAFLRAAVAEAMAQGRLRPELKDVDLVCQVFWAGVHGLVSIEITMKGDEWMPFPPLRRRIELLLETLVRGLVRGMTSEGKGRKR